MAAAVAVDTDHLAEIADARRHQCGQGARRTVVATKKSQWSNAGRSVSQADRAWAHRVSDEEAGARYQLQRSELQRA